MRLKEPEHPLIHWLKDQQGEWKENIEQRARELAEKFRDALQNARVAAGVPQNAPDFGPSKSQWGSVLEAARRKSGDDLYQQLFQAPDAAIKNKMPGWNVETPDGAGESKTWNTLADWLKEKLTYDGVSPAQYTHLVRRLAHQMRGDTHKQKRSA